MKIKEVCEKTGLTDRTIRYYMECGLLTPSNKQNYAGRKQFTFTREDAERLEMIKTFRGAGFSVEQIKRLFQSRSSREVVQEHLRELEADRKKSEQLYETLKKADMDREVSAEELAIIVASASSDKECATQVFAEDADISAADAGAIQPLFLRIGYVIVSVLWCTFLSKWWLALLAAVGIGIGIWILHKHSVKIQILALLILWVLLLSVGVAGRAYYQPKTLDKTAYGLIGQIPWNDYDYLKQKGFYKTNIGLLEGDNDHLRYLKEDYTPAREKSGDPRESTLCIDVFKSDNETEPGDSARQYGDVYIQESQTVRYDTLFSWWIGRPYYTERVYEVYVDGCKVYVHEINKESGNVIYFEQALLDLI